MLEIDVSKIEEIFCRNETYENSKQTSEKRNQYSHIFNGKFDLKNFLVFLFVETVFVLYFKNE